VTNDVPAAPGGSGFTASSGSDGAQTASPATVTPPAAVLNLAIQVGDCLLSAGMSANDVVVAMLGVTDAYGLTRVHVDVTYTSISASYYPTRGTPPITCIRVVQPDDIDYSKVRGVARLEEKIRAGLPIDEATRAFDRIQEAPHRYSQWVAMIGNAGVSAGAAVLFTTSWKIILATFLTGLIVDRMLAAMEHWRVPPFFQQFAGAGFITLVAAGIAEAAAQGVSFFVGVDPTLVVVGGIIMLVAGMAIVGAAQDAIDQFYVTASARLLDVTMRTAGIVVGIVASLELASLLGAPLAISPNPVALGPLGAQLVGATLTSAFFALWAYADLATIGLAGAMGLLGWVGYTLMIYVGVHEVPANTVGAFAAALASTLLIRRSTIPGFGLVSAALLPLVPGFALYNGLLQVVGTSPETANPTAGGSTLLLALGVALGIAAGATLGTYLGRPIADQLRRIPTRPSRLLRRSGARMLRNRRASVSRP
jgi:uncharacterized membrane protein YjjP (DUF1212 family)